MAIGAEPARILTLVAREIGLLAALGVVIGIAGVLGAGRLLAAMLVGVSATNVVTIAATTLTLLVAGAAAMLVPARTAMRTDPSTTLRQT